MYPTSTYCPFALDLASFGPEGHGRPELRTTAGAGPFVMP